MTRPQRQLQDIEDCLSWAYRDELPKGLRREGGSSPQISPMFRMAAFGGPVENWSREPGFPAAMGEPHPDALAVGRAVGALAGWIPAPLPEGWLSEEFAGLEVDERHAFRTALASVMILVQVNARLRRRPLFDGPPIPGRRILSNGKPAVLEADYVTEETVDGRLIGHDTVRPAVPIRAGIYRPGAYCPLRYEPDPAVVTLERAEYAVWHAALTRLAEQLHGELATISVLSPSAPERPWRGETDAGKPVPIYEDLRARVHRTDRAEAERRPSTPSARRRVPRDPGRRVPRESWPARLAGAAGKTK